MKRIGYIAILIFVSVSLFAQAPYQKWLYQLGNTGQALGEISVQVNSEGDIIVGGGFQGYYDFDYGPAVVSKKGAYFVQKLNKKGELIWLKVWNTPAIEERRKMVIDKDDNIYFCGSYYGDVDFDLGDNTVRLVNGPVFVVKLDSDGDFIWAKGFGGGDNIGQGYANHILDMAVDDDKNVFLIGSFLGTANFATDDGEQLATSNGETDIFVLKLDANGDFEWVKTMGGYEYDYPLSMEVDVYGNIYTTGEFIGKIDADPSSDLFWLQSYGYYDAFVQKLNTDGDLVWAYNLGASGYDSGRVLTVSDKCDVYVGGIFKHVADFDPGPEIVNIFSPAGHGDIFVQKINCDGVFQWAKVLGSGGADWINDIFVDELDQVFVTGTVQGAADLDPGEDSFMTDNTDFSGFTIKLAQNGDFIWGMNARGAQSSTTVVEGDKEGNIFVIGTFLDTVNFHPNRDSISDLISFGDSDVYFQKLRHCDESFHEIFIKTCEAYSSPSGKYIINTDATFQDTILNRSGCDSVLTIHVDFAEAAELINAIKVGPNPTLGTVQLKSDFPLCETHVRVYAINGKQLFENKITQAANEITVSLEQLPKGTYILMIGKNDDFTVHRIVKK